MNKLPRVISLEYTSASRSVIMRSTGAYGIRKFSSCQIRHSTTLKANKVVDSSYKTTNVKDLLHLTGKNIVVTGGGRGIGLALAYAVAQVGGNVAVVDALDKPHEDFAGLKSLGVKSEIYKADVAKYDQINSTFDKIAKDFGRIDGCITAAGILVDKPFLEHGWEETYKLQMINTLGTFFCAQAAARHMRSQNTPGSIVLIASITGNGFAIPAQQLSAYGASKAYVKGLGGLLGVELAPYDIRVNSISPGYIRTDMTGKVGAERPTLMEFFTTAPPMKRIGEKTDLMAAAVYFLSEASAYTTGADLQITGGMHAGRNG
ncbi:short-chain dehydrogenase/reductase SDR [Xylogone sp. PMI_703]|nr:short-chain dehydrogenase/reductase SDR [Xylogone sp. PMI_703]